MNDKKGKTICVYSPKGGVGKSMISANMAGVSFLMDKKTLLIDADLYDGGLSLFIDKPIDKTIYTLSDDFKNNKFEMLYDYVYHYNEKIDILCAPKTQLQSGDVKVKYIESIITLAKQMYDIIIIDTNSSYNDLNKRIFNEVDEILIILTNDMINIKNVRNITSIFKKENKSYKVLLNTSFDFKEKYFSNYEIINLINSNIDYTLDRDSFFKNITLYLYHNEIPILYKDNETKYYNVVERFKLILQDLIKKGDKNE